jgi:hypothetical protein
MGIGGWWFDEWIVTFFGRTLRRRQRRRANEIFSCTFTTMRLKADKQFLSHQFL